MTGVENFGTLVPSAGREAVEPLLATVEGSLLPPAAPPADLEGLGHCQSLEELGAALVHAARRRSPSSFCALWIRMEPPEAGWRLLPSSGPSLGGSEDEVVVRILKSLQHSAEAQSWYLDGGNEPLVQEWMKAQGIVSLLALPVLVHGVTRAVLLCGKGGPSWRFGVTEQRELRTLCQRAGPLLENLRLLEQTREALTGLQNLRRGVGALRRGWKRDRPLPSPELALSSVAEWVVSQLGYASWALTLRGRRRQKEAGDQGELGWSGKGASHIVLRGHGVAWRTLRPLDQETLARTLQDLPQEKVSLARSLLDLLGSGQEALTIQGLQSTASLRTWVCIPLVAGEEVVGALWAVTDRLRIPAEEQCLLLELGYQLGFLWENARLQREAVEHAHRLETINRITHLVASTSDLSRIFPHVAKEIRKLVPYDRLVLARLDETGSSLVEFLVVGRRIPGWPSPGAVPLEHTTSAEVIAGGQPLLRRDIATERCFPFDERLLKAGLRSSATLPLWGQDRVLGVMVLLSCHPEGFDEGDLVLLQPLMEHLALALEKTHLLKKAQATTAHLDAIRRQLRLLSITADLPKVFRPLSTEIRHLVPYDRLALAVLEGSKRQVRRLFEAGKRPAGYAQALRVPLEDTGLGGVLATGQPLIRRDILQGPHFPGDEHRIRAGFRSSLLFPLVAEGEAIGGLILTSTQPGAYNDYHVAILEPVCEYLALALKNAQHLQAVQERQRQVEELLAKVVLAQERERQRIALDLHDSIGQWLVRALHEVRALSAIPVEACPSLASLEALFQQNIVELRRVLQDLHPPELQERGLMGVLRQAVEQLSRRSGVSTTFTTRGDIPIPPLSVETTLYRIVQEALNNIGRHAHARRVDVSLHSIPGQLVIEVADDGHGFDLGQALEGCRLGRSAGLTGMQERAELIQAALHIETAPGGGTRLFLELPLDRLSGIPPAPAAGV